MTRKGAASDQISFYWGQKTTAELETIHSNSEAKTGDYAYDTNKDVVLFYDSNIGWGSQQYVPMQTLADSSSGISTDCRTGNVFAIVLNNTIATRELSNPTNHKAGATYIWIITQDSTGGAELTFGSAFKFPNSSTPSITTAASAVSLISGVSNGTNIYCSSTLNLG